MRAARYDRYGPPRVIEIVDIDDPVAGAGEVLVQLDAAGLNPADYKVRRGATPIRPLPSGIGREFSGRVVAVGDGVEGRAVGDLVIGTGEWVIGELYAAPAELVTERPPALDAAIAACLPVAPQTAWCALRSQALAPGSTVFISAVAGGVGFIAAQLAVRNGLRVIGSASARHDDSLAAIGVERVDYGAGLADRLRVLAPAGIDAVLDHHGAESIEAALELGIDRVRINSVSGYADRYAVASVGRVGLDASVINELATLVLDGDITVPIEARYPLDYIVTAYEHLERGTPAGRIVIEI